MKVNNGKIESIKNGMGIAGIKGVRSDELIYHPDRIIYPLKRMGKRGEGKWSRISWEKTLDMMADRFIEIKNAYGPEAIATIIGCGHKEMAYYATFLFSHVVGTPNVLDINRQCNIPTVIGEMTTYGESILQDPGPDFLRSKCILVWGANPRHTRPPLERDICLAAKNGAKIIVIDPRPPERLDSDVKPADLWLKVKPGTDAFLALAMINVIIEEKLYDDEFVQQWCVGFEELSQHVRKFSPGKAEKITWVPRDKIVEASRLFSQKKPSCLHTRLGASSQHINATQTARAIAIFAALGGSIDTPGGNLLADSLGGYRHQRTISQLPVFPPGVEEKRYGVERYPFICSPKEKMDFFPSLRRSHSPDCIEAFLNSDIKAFYIPGCNIVLSEGNSKRVWEALQKLDFLVVAELFMTPTAELADLVLPAAHFLETELPMRAYQRMGPMVYNYILASRKIVEPRGECWDDRKIVFELAKRMKIKIPWKSLEEFNDWTLEPVGIKFKELQNRRAQQLSFPLRYEKYKKNGFRTPSGKIELYAKSLEQFGYDPLPSYREPFKGHFKGVISKRFQFLMISHRDVHYMHSEFRQLPSIRSEYPDPLIEINPRTARNLKIEEGDEIYIETLGFKWRVRGRAKFIPEIHPKVISCVSHWWFPEIEGPEHGCFQSNINTIIAYGPPNDPVTGAHQGRAIPCMVSKK
ncbi:MAG: molybdopterin-dependent oxidoreductase [Thermodesulfobacteriota bacterium]|nr:molybdopterin-dependent oxidoreductase [Thermodesulfobacteriota bacterium]